jgi:hypothetical protein
VKTSSFLRLFLFGESGEILRCLVLPWTCCFVSLFPLVEVRRLETISFKEWRRAVACGTIQFPDWDNKVESAETFRARICSQKTALAYYQQCRREASLLPSDSKTELERRRDFAILRQTRRCCISTLVCDVLSIVATTNIVKRCLYNDAQKGRSG